MSVFFLGSWGMNRSTEQTNRPRTASRFTRFVCPALRFIPLWTQKKRHSFLKYQDLPTTRTCVCWLSETGTIKGVCDYILVITDHYTIFPGSSNEEWNSKDNRWGSVLQRNSHAYGPYWPSFQSPILENMEVVLYNKGLSNDRTIHSAAVDTSFDTRFEFSNFFMRNKIR